MNRTIRDLLVVASGLLTTSATALVIWLSLHYFQFAIYSFSYWFIPVGAIFCGVAAGSGYYWSARKLNHKATKLVLANLLSMSVSTYFVVQYLQYYYLDIQGQHVRDLISFPAFLDIVIRRSTIGLAFGPQSGALGVFGYALVLLPIAGFALSGYSLYYQLRFRAYCHHCEAYLEPGMSDSRYAVWGDEMTLLFGALKVLYRDGRFTEAIVFFAAWGQKVPPQNCMLRTDIVVCPCPKCGGQWIQFQGYGLANDEYRPHGDWYVAGFSPTPLVRQPPPPTSLAPA
jgi:hypothetical protein